MNTEIQDEVNALTEPQQHAYCIILSGMVWPDVRGWVDWRDTLRLLLASPLQHRKAIKQAKAAHPPRQSNL